MCLQDNGLKSKRRLAAKLSKLMRYLVRKLKIAAACWYTLIATRDVVTASRYSCVARMREQDRRALAGPFFPPIYRAVVRAPVRVTVVPLARTSPVMCTYTRRWLRT